MVGNEGTFATDTEILKRCGTSAHADVKVAGFFDKIIVEMEGIVNCATRYDWVTADGVTALTATVRGILADTTACLAAIEGIIYDMASYTTRNEAESMITVLRDRAQMNMGILRDKKTQSFLKLPTTGNT